jgi:hypothetical protein
MDGIAVYHVDNSIMSHNSFSSMFNILFDDVCSYRVFYVMQFLFKIATGYTTNEKLNGWRYSYLKPNRSSPFSFGCIQNLVDLIDRHLLWYTPIQIDWSRIYSLDDFYRSISVQVNMSKRRLSSYDMVHLSHV